MPPVTASFLGELPRVTGGLATTLHKHRCAAALGCSRRREQRSMSSLERVALSCLWLPLFLSCFFRAFTVGRIFEIWSATPLGGIQWE